MFHRIWTYYHLDVLKVNYGEIKLQRPVFRLEHGLIFDLPNSQAIHSLSHLCLIEKHFSPLRSFLNHITWEAIPLFIILVQHVVLLDYQMPRVSI